eukprot:2629123-Prymnesium_polylepis.2
MPRGLRHCAAHTAVASVQRDQRRSARAASPRGATAQRVGNSAPTATPPRPPGAPAPAPRGLRGGPWARPATPAHRKRTGASFQRATPVCRGVWARPDAHVRGTCTRSAMKRDFSSPPFRSQLERTEPERTRT